MHERLKVSHFQRQREQGTLVRALPIRGNGATQSGVLAEEGLVKIHLLTFVFDGRVTTDTGFNGSLG